MVDLEAMRRAQRRASIVTSSPAFLALRREAESLVGLSSTPFGYLRRVMRAVRLTRGPSFDDPPLLNVAADAWQLINDRLDVRSRVRLGGTCIFARHRFCVLRLHNHLGFTRPPSLLKVSCT